MVTCVVFCFQSRWVNDEDRTEGDTEGGQTGSYLPRPSQYAESAFTYHAER